MRNPMKWIILLCVLGGAANPRAEATRYDPNPMQPFGRPNPAAPPEARQFAFMIGSNDCTEEKRNNAGGEWVAGATRIWDAAWYMNGYAVRDWGTTSGGYTANVRTYDPARGQWNVAWLSMPGYSSGTWSGGKEGDNIVLKQPQASANGGLPGFSRLTFHDIAPTSFRWIGEWVSEDGSIVYPFWRISCVKLDAS